MSDWNDDETTEEPQHASIPVEDLRNMRAAAKGRKEAEERAQAAERKLAFVEAGVNLTDPKAQYFIKGYDGEIDPEKIRDAAMSAGFISAPQVPADEAAANQRITQASDNATAIGEVDWESEYAKATNEAEVLAVARRKGTPIAGEMD
jgi:hypothetical protein